MLKKLNAVEILGIIEENYSQDDFAYGEWHSASTLPENFKFSDNVERIKKEREEKYFAYINHPGYKSTERKDEEWERVRKEYLNAPLEYTERGKEILNFLGLGEVENIEQVGGEGQGDHWHQVWYFKDHDVFIKIVGSYSSYHGVEFYDGYGTEVKPVEKIITVFETCKS